MNYAYIRVSTDSQTVENQRLAIRNYAEKKGNEGFLYGEHLYRAFATFNGKTKETRAFITERVRIF